MTRSKESRNSGFWIPSPQTAAWEIHDMCNKYSTKSIPVNKIVKFHRPIFLRSPMLEYKDVNEQEYKEDKNHGDALKPVPKRDLNNPLEYTQVTRLKLDCPLRPGRSEKLNPYSYGPIGPWKPQPQFWYIAKSAHQGPTWPVGNPNDYSFKSLEEPEKEHVNIIKALEIECPERYIPGEIYKNKFPKDPAEDLSETGGCVAKWVPKKKGVFNSKPDPSGIPPQALLSVTFQETETKLRERLQPTGPFHKISQPFSEVKKQVKFRPQSEETTENTEANKPKVDTNKRNVCYNDDPFRNCKKDKYIFKSEGECNSCNKYQVKN